MSSRLDERIKDLLVLARDGSRDSRNQLYRHLADLFLSGHAPKDQAARASLCEFLETLSPEVDLAERLSVARSLTAMPKPPMDFAEVLACDDLTVAAGVLKDISFPTRQLLRIIQKTGRRHHWLIAERDCLEHDVWLSLAGVGLADKETDSHGISMPSTEHLNQDQRGKKESMKALPEIRKEQAAAGFARQTALKNHQGGWDWAVDREGLITFLSEGAEKAFARKAPALLGLDFLALVEGDESPLGHDLFRETFRHRRPMRDIPVRIEDAYGRVRDWCLRARADFDLKTGRFLGYHGRALPPMPLHSDVPAASQPAAGEHNEEVPAEIAAPASGHALAKIVKKILKKDARRHLTEEAYKLKKASAEAYTVIAPAILTGCLTFLLGLSRQSAGAGEAGGKVKIFTVEDRPQISLPIRSDQGAEVSPDIVNALDSLEDRKQSSEKSDAIVAYKNWRNIIRSQGGDLGFVRKGRNKGRLILELPTL